MWENEKESPLSDAVELHPGEAREVLGAPSPGDVVSSLHSTYPGSQIETFPNPH